MRVRRGRDLGGPERRLDRALDGVRQLVRPFDGQRSIDGDRHVGEELAEMERNPTMPIVPRVSNLAWPYG
jgi:hypothetical protein